MTKLLHQTITDVKITHTSTIRGRIGHDITHYGSASFGEMEFGADEITGKEDWGIYQMRDCKEGYIPVKMRFNQTTTYRNSEAQQATRAKYGAAVGAWRALSEQAKNIWRELAKGQPLHGFNLFLKDYFQNN